MGDILVAVYGSLKEGRGNHHLLKDSLKVGEGLTNKQFQMVSFRAFPGLVEAEEESAKVKVEVYSVTKETFERLDSLEGYPSFYNRQEVDVSLDDDKVVRPWIYVLNERVNQPLVLPKGEDGSEKYLEW